jgi:hypothetical protein
MQATIRKRSHLANGRILISIPPLRESSSSEHLPWEPGCIDLTPNERQVLVWLWRELTQELGPEEVISESDVLHFALQELQLKFRDSKRVDVLLRLGYYLSNVRQ